MSSKSYTPADAISRLVVALPPREDLPNPSASLDDWLCRIGYSGK